MRIRIEVDGEVTELVDDQIVEEFSWHNVRNSNHCRRVRRKILEALLVIAKAGNSNGVTTGMDR